MKIGKRKTIMRLDSYVRFFLTAVKWCGSEILSIIKVVIVIDLIAMSNSTVFGDFHYPLQENTCISNITLNSVITG